MCIHTYVDKHKHVHKHIHTHSHQHTHAFARPPARMHVRTYARTHINTHTYTHIHAHTPSHPHSHWQTHTRTDTHTRISNKHYLVSYIPPCGLLISQRLPCQEPYELMFWMEILLNLVKSKCQHIHVYMFANIAALDNFRFSLLPVAACIL